MKTKQILIDVLLENNRFSSYEEVSAFDKSLEELSSIDHLEMSDLIKLFQVFDDKTENEEVMFGLLHFLEDFELETFIESFIKALPEMNPKASGWIKTFHYRILNSESAREIFKSKITSANSESKTIIQNTLSKIAENEAIPASSVARELKNLI